MLVSLLMWASSTAGALVQARPRGGFRLDGTPGGAARTGCRDRGGALQLWKAGAGTGHDVLGAPAKDHGIAQAGGQG